MAAEGKEEAGGGRPAWQRDGGSAPGACRIHSSSITVGLLAVTLSSEWPGTESTSWHCRRMEAEGMEQVEKQREEAARLGREMEDLQVHLLPPSFVHISLKTEYF